MMMVQRKHVDRCDASGNTASLPPGLCLTPRLFVPSSFASSHHALRQPSVLRERHAVCPV